MKTQTGQAITVGTMTLLPTYDYNRLLTYQHRAKLIGQIAFWTSLVMLFVTVSTLESGAVSPVFALVSGLAWAGGMAAGGDVGGLKYECLSAGPRKECEEEWKARVEADTLEDVSGEYEAGK